MRRPSYKAPRKKSNTTIIGVRYDNCSIIGADSRATEPFYGRVLTNSFEKISEVYKGICIAGSGDGDALSDVTDFLEKQFKLDPPQSIEEAAYETAVWVNLYMKRFRSGAHLLLIGAVAGETPKMFFVRNEKGNPKPFVERVKDKFVVHGSGEDIAESVLKNNSYIKERNISEEKGCKLVFDALKEAALREPGTGGTLHVVYMTPGSSKFFYCKQKNPKYCKSPYGEPKLEVGKSSNAESESSDGEETEETESSDIETESSDEEQEGR